MEDAVEGGADAGVDAQSLISMSVLKLQRSRTQRGGIKLHRNLLLSYVLRNARQLYVTERYAELHRGPRTAVCTDAPELDPRLTETDKEDKEDAGRAQCRQSGAPPEDAGKAAEPSYYRSCCAAPAPVPVPAPPCGHCGHTTVLDLDTHVVSTVHLDCCGQGARAAAAARKHKLECGCCARDADDAWEHCARRKRPRREECPDPSDPEPPGPSDPPEPAHASGLMSLLGSGFSGLLSRHADLEQLCAKQALAGLGAWTRAIVAC